MMILSYVLCVFHYIMSAISSHNGFFSFIIFFVLTLFIEILSIITVNQEKKRFYTNPFKSKLTIYTQIQAAIATTNKPFPL